MDKRMVVVIDSWQADSMYPAGHYVRTLGTIGDKETETEVLLIENDINTSPFSPAVHACVPLLPWSVTQADLDDPNRWVIPNGLHGNFMSNLGFILLLVLLLLPLLLLLLLLLLL